jgi:hypothetical protein
MKQIGLLFFILGFIITGCDTETNLGANSDIELQNKKDAEGQNNIPKEKSDGKESIPTPTPKPTPKPTPTPTSTHEDLETKKKVNEKSFKYFELSPVDQAVEDESLIKFREELIANIKERNIDFLNKYFDEKGTWDFGGTTKEQLLESWDEENWLELQKAVLLGGAFYDEEKTQFFSPYTFKLFPEEFDAFEFEAAIKDQVEVYIHKDVDSKLIGMLNYTIVKRRYEDDNYDPNWKKIEMSDGRVGYVIGDNIRSPIDYRVGFEKVNNDWKITFFLAGD